MNSMNFRKLILVFSLLLILLSSGCINIEVYQKLKRTGLYDMDITMSTGQEYKMILNAFKESYKVDDSVKNKFTYSETETSITYSFKDLDPQKDKKLFKEVEKKNGDTADATYSSYSSMFGQTQQTPDTSLLEPGDVEFKKDFKFPYYEFTYKIKKSPKSTEEVRQNEILSQKDYILDEADILNENTKDRIMQSINNIYKNDSIEMIIVTKKQMKYLNYYSYKLDLINNFKFKGKNKEYIIIFASTNEDGLCKVESNIYLDSKAYSKILALDTDFSDNCKMNYKEQIVSVVNQLDNFFKENDLESTKKTEESLGKLLKIGYTVEVFGKVTDTNGLRMGDNKVKFDINPYKEEEYIVTFQDFFLVTLLGDDYWIYLSVVGVVLLGGIGFITFSKIRKKQKSMPLLPPLSVNPRVLEYVTKARAAGMTDDKIKNILIQCGWSSEEIDVALKSR